LAQLAVGVVGEAVNRGRAVAKDHGLGDLKVGDGARLAVDVQAEALHAGVVAQAAAARAAVGQAPPLVATGVVVDVGEVAHPTVVGRGASREVIEGARQHEAVDEFDGRVGGGAEAHGGAQGGGQDGAVQDGHLRFLLRA